MKKLLAFLYFALMMAANLLPLSLARASADVANLIANPSVEIADSSGNPANWKTDKWGTNTTSMTYKDGGHTGNKSLYIDMTARTNGDAKWIADAASVSPNTSYAYSEFYKSNAITELDAQYTDTNGAVTYAYLRSVSPANDWAQISTTLTTPANVAKITILHIVYGAGWLQTDDFSLSTTSPTPPPSTPTVSLTAPTAGSMVSGSVQLSATAADSSGIAGVQFKVDEVNIGNEVIPSPYQTSWDTTTAANGTHVITAVARNTSGATATSNPVSVTVNNTIVVPPGNNLVSNPSVETPDPANSAQPQGWANNKWGTNAATFTYLTSGGHTGTRSVKVQITSYTSGDAKWYFTPVAVQPNTLYNFTDYYQSNAATSVVAQFDDGNGSLTYKDLAAPVSNAAWTQVNTSFTTPANAKFVTIFHLINKVGTLQIDDASLAISTAPIVSITAPVSNSTVGGSVQVSASASAAAGIANVQFKLDGTSLGAAVTSAPYQVAWDTTSTSNGSHVLTAVATSNDNKAAISSSVTVNVSNQTGNMVPNPSMEIPDPANSKAPKDWQSSVWGTNTTTFTYLTSGGHTGTDSVKVQMTKYTDGDAKWYFAPQAISSDTQYTFSDYYKSNIPSEIDVAFTMSDGSTVYEFIGNPDPSTQWKQFKTNFSVPFGAVNATVFHLIHGVGTLTIDDASMQKYIPVGFSRALVSITFDDGIASQYTNGLPILQKYGFNATFYIISGVLGSDPSYMTTNQVKALNIAGEEIGSHTVSHPDLTSLSATQLTKELSQSQTTLQQLLGIPVKDFAAPYGLVNTNVTTQIKKYYQTERGIEYGFNDKTSFNPYDIKVQDVDINTTTAQVSDWVNQAKTTNTWLVLVYHAVDPDSATVGQYDVLPSSLDAQLGVIKSSGITVETLAQALAEITPQL